ncbi:hypothetical protein RUND412_006574 [Rhizina undulata]
MEQIRQNFNAAKTWKDTTEAILSTSPVSRYCRGTRPEKRQLLAVEAAEKALEGRRHSKVQEEKQRQKRQRELEGEKAKKLRRQMDGEESQSQALRKINLIARSTRFGDVGVKDLVMLPERPVKPTRKAPKVVPETNEEEDNVQSAVPSIASFATSATQGHEISSPGPDQDLVATEDEDNASDDEDESLEDEDEASEDEDKASEETAFEGDGLHLSAEPEFQFKGMSPSGSFPVIDSQVSDSDILLSEGQRDNFSVTDSHSYVGRECVTDSHLLKKDESLMLYHSDTGSESTSHYQPEAAAQQPNTGVMGGDSTNHRGNINLPYVTNLASEAAFLCEGKTTPADGELLEFHYALTLFAIATDLSVSQYSSLVEVVKLATIDEIQALPSSLSTLKENVRRKLPLSKI